MLSTPNLRLDSLGTAFYAVIMIHAPELAALEARAHAARITMSELCTRAGKHRQSWYRARKRGRAEYTLIHPLEKELREVEKERGILLTDSHRGWTIRQGRWPEPAWMATGPDYDAWTEGEGEWADNGRKADAPTREALIAEIDAWFEENGNG